MRLLFGCSRARHVLQRHGRHAAAPALLQTTSAVSAASSLRLRGRRLLSTTAMTPGLTSAPVVAEAVSGSPQSLSQSQSQSQPQPQPQSMVSPTGRKFTHVRSTTPAAEATAATASSASSSSSAASTVEAASRPSIETRGDYMLPHPIWSESYMNAIQQTHQPPRSFSDRLALGLIRAMRFNFDWMSGYTFARRKTEKMWLGRILFLESVAGVPGSIGATVRHLASLRRLKRDHGWIHTLLEEGENERMHLLTAMELRSPGLMFRAAILLTQGVFFNFYFLSYLISPSFCHRVVGYLEEEAVKTYTTLLDSIDKGEVWRGTPAPLIARDYWRLPPTATMRDVIANIRADETHHRDVNHRLSDIGTTGVNPFPPGH